MAKYSFELKKKVVTAYINGEGGCVTLAQKFGISNECIVRQWVHNYETFGIDSLLRSRQNDVYSFERKLYVVELYLSSEISYRDLALQEGITNSSLIANWVNRFRAAGPDALRPRKKGRKKTLDKPKNDTTPKPIEETAVDTNVEHVKELEDELLKLRIENAFLKELRRLRLEDEAKMREQRESSTVSEENSD